MKKIYSLVMLSVVAVFFSMEDMNAAAKKKTVYYFYAENCEACKRAQNHFKKPESIKANGSWDYNGITFIQYRIVDENNKLIHKNINKLNAICSQIVKKTGKKDIVYYDRDVYEYYNNKGIPHYRKEGRYARKDEAFPTPVFIIGDRIILGFNLTNINYSISLLE